MSSPKLYATFLLWMLSELFEQLPEVGDPDKPQLVFFFDEAHLLFNDAPKALLEKIEQVVRLIRSKGVGVYFVTQNPLDIPDTVLGQLGNRVQHALRAFTPRDQKAVKAAARDDAAEPGFRHRAGDHRARRRRGARVAARREGQAGRHGARVDRAARQPLGPLTDAERARVIAASPVAGVYEKAVDRESAYEKLKARVEQKPAPPTRTARQREAPPARREPAPQPQQRSDGGSLASDILFGAPRPARRPPVARADRGDGEERRARRRLAGRPLADPRRARLAARRSPLTPGYPGTNEPLSR